MNNITVQAKILAVDDAPENRLLLEEMLEEEYEVRLAASGPEALQLAVAEQPDLILLDIMMPKMSGYEVCQQLQDDPQTMDIPVIFITVLDREENEYKGLDMGAVDYITKPFNLRIVQARIRNHLELKQHREFLRALLKKQEKELQANRKALSDIKQLHHEILGDLSYRSPEIVIQNE